MMRGFWKEFLFRGLICSGGGPLVLAIIYGILGATGTVDSLAPGAVCMGILSVMLLAFAVAGMTAIYQVERLPLFVAILLHGGTLYVAYILIYLLNGWLQKQLVAVTVFTAVFVAGYAVIWLIIFAVNKIKTAKLNKLLKRQ